MEVLTSALGHIDSNEWMGMDMEGPAQGVTDFGWALRALKVGKKVFRPGWCAGEFIVLQRGYPEGIAINQNTADATGLPMGTVCIFKPYFMLCMLDKSFVPWVPSVTDCLAEDWLVKEM